MRQPTAAAPAPVASLLDPIFLGVRIFENYFSLFYRIISAILGKKVVNMY